MDRKSQLIEGKARGQHIKLNVIVKSDMQSEVQPQIVYAINLFFFFLGDKSIYP